MKFDVVRASDFEMGRTGCNAPCPIEGAVFNPMEERWELEVESLESLLELADELTEAPLILHGTDGEGLGLLEIYDVCEEDNDDGPEEPYTVS